MAPIATYVFLDLETTGIPHVELNKTKITEMSMVAVKRTHILDTVAGALPRVLNKFTMCFNPGRMIDPGATKASGLDNDLLEHDTPFNMNVFNSINFFIESQLKPVCLVAQNGFNFDFPILKNHFEKLNVSLSDDIMCADSLDAFYDILKPIMNTASKLPSNIHLGESSTRSEDELLELDIIVIEDDSDEETNTSVIKGDAEESCSKKKDVKLNTPKTIQQQNETTPKSRKIKTITSAKKLRDIRRKLFYDGDKKPTSSFKLKDIYERVMGRPGIEAHRAENDCIMTAEIATAKAKQFINWVDANHCSFTEVIAMKLGVPL